MNVQEIMSKPVVTCRLDDNLNTAAQRMWEHDCGCLPVVNHEGSVMGIVTDRDICMAAYTRGAALHAIPVTNAMARQVFLAHPHDSLEGAERMMSDKQIRRLPVVDRDGRPIGMLSLSDLARHTASSKKKNGGEHVLTETLAAISQPRAHVLAGRASEPQVFREQRAH